MYVVCDAVCYTVNVLMWAAESVPVCGVKTIPQLLLYRLSAHFHGLPLLRLFLH